MQRVLSIALFVVFASNARCAGRTENVVLVTYDGLRWQEVFQGADATLLNKENGGVSRTNEARKAFWRPSPEARREVLLPFLWKVVAKQGQLFGNTNKGSVAKVTNGLKFSYPGYHELLVGFPDARIKSNEYGPNPNITVLEWLNGRARFRGKVAAFCSWSAFNDILNRERSGLVVQADATAKLPGKLTPRQRLLRDLVRDTEPPFETVVNDSLTFYSALEFVKERKPRVLYIGFDETDDWAHDKHYDRVLEAAQRIDRFIEQLWKTIQAMPMYRGKTTLMITTDHGRGDAPVNWKTHGGDTEGAEYIWMAFMGPDTPPLGERSNTALVTQAQIAATLAAFLGEDYVTAAPKAAQPIKDVFAPVAQPSKSGKQTKAASP